jgi:hypothetical protein
VIAAPIQIPCIANTDAVVDIANQLQLRPLQFIPALPSTSATTNVQATGYNSNIKIQTAA